MSKDLDFRVVVDAATAEVMDRFTDAMMSVPPAQRLDLLNTLLSGAARLITCGILSVPRPRREIALEDVFRTMPEVIRREISTTMTLADAILSNREETLQ